MLKLLYKTLLVSLLSGSLLMLDFSYKGAAIVQFNSAQAETLKTGSSKSDNDLMSTLTMTGVGLLTQRLYTCKMSTDMMIAAAGGAAFLAGEVTSFLSQKNAQKELETQIERDKNGKPTEQQIEILKKLKESYEAARKTANMKKMFQMAAAAAFAAAAVAAYMMEATEQTAFKACQTAATTASESCPELAGSASSQIALVQALQSTRIIPKPSASGEAASTAGQGEVVGGAAKAAADGVRIAGTAAATCASSEGSDAFHCDEAGQCAPAGSSITTACQPISPLLKTTDGFCPAPLAIGLNSTSNGSSKQLYSGINGHLNVVFLNVLGKMLMPEAKADLFSPLGIASSLAISYLLTTSKTLGATIDSYLLAPINRAIIWGILAGLTYAASSATDSQISQINSDIDKIDRILNSMNNLNNGVTVAQTPQMQNTTVEKTIIPEVKAGVNNYQTPSPVDFSAAGGKLPCMTGDKSCPSFSSQMNNALSAPGSTVGLTQAQLGALNTMADGVNGTSSISSGTIKSAETLASQAVALRSEMEKQKKKAQDALKASGSKQDLSKTEGDLERLMREAMEKELKSRNMSAGAMLASMGSGFGSGSSGSASAAIATDANKNAKATAAKKPVIAPVGVVDMSSSLNAGKGLNNGLTLDANKKDDAALTADAAKAGAGATMDDYVLKNDITQDKDSSLFDLISNRYQKSGYPRLFKKIK